MFSGIVETTSRVVMTTPAGEVLRIGVERPPDFGDLRPGDSIATDGVCLTLEEFDHRQMIFALGPETLRVTGWTAEGVRGRVVNLERSLRLNDRIHGHLVTGHVDARARVLECQREGETLQMRVEIPPAIRLYVWPKGSVAINGVSLTVNAVDKSSFQVGLIPETLKRTSLGGLKPGDHVNLEADNMARGLVHWAKLQEEKK